VRPWPTTLLTGGVIGGLRQVAAVLVAVAVQLAFDRGGAAAQFGGDAAHRVTQPQQVRDLQPLPQRQVASRRCSWAARGGLLTMPGADPPAVRLVTPKILQAAVFVSPERMSCQYRVSRACTSERGDRVRISSSACRAGPPTRCHAGLLYQR
jgi:hypothetical protein